MNPEELAKLAELSEQYRQSAGGQNLQQTSPVQDNSYGFDDYIKDSSKRENTALEKLAEQKELEQKQKVETAETEETYGFFKNLGNFSKSVLKQGYAMALDTAGMIGEFVTGDAHNYIPDIPKTGYETLDAVIADNHIVKALQHTKDLHKWIDNTIGDGEDDVGNFLTQEAANVREHAERWNKVKTGIGYKGGWTDADYWLNGTAAILGSAAGGLGIGGVARGLAMKGLINKAVGSAITNVSMTGGVSAQIGQGVYNDTYDYVLEENADYKANKENVYNSAYQEFLSKADPKDIDRFRYAEEYANEKSKEYKTQYAIDNPEIDKAARKAAAKGADVAIKTNVLFGVVSNLGISKVLMKGLGKTPTRKFNKLGKEKKSFWERTEFARESFMEGVEESFLEPIAEQRGLLAGMDKSYNYSDAWQKLNTDEMVEQFFWGAAGGAFTTGGGYLMSRNARKKERESARKEIKKQNEILEASGSISLNEMVYLGSSINKQNEIIKQANFLKSQGKKAESDALYNKVISMQAIDAFKTGTAENLENVYSYIAKDPKNDQETRDNAKKALADIKNYEKIYNETSSKDVYNTQDLYTNRVSKYNINKSLSDLETQIANEKTLLATEIATAKSAEKLPSLKATFEKKGDKPGDITIYEDEVGFDPEDLIADRKFDIEEHKSKHEAFKSEVSKFQSAKNLKELEATKRLGIRKLAEVNSTYNTLTSKKYQQELYYSNKLKMKLSNDKVNDKLNESMLNDSEEKYNALLDKIFKPYENKIPLQRINQLKTKYLQDKKAVEETKKEEVKKAAEKIANTYNKEQDNSTSEEPAVKKQTPITTEQENKDDFEKENPLVDEEDLSDEIDESSEDFYTILGENPFADDDEFIIGDENDYIDNDDEVLETEVGDGYEDLDFDLDEDDETLETEVADLEEVKTDGSEQGNIFGEEVDDNFDEEGDIDEEDFEFDPKELRSNIPQEKLNILKEKTKANKKALERKLGREASLKDFIEATINKIGFDKTKDLFDPLVDMWEAAGFKTGDLDVLYSELFESFDNLIEDYVSSLEPETIDKNESKQTFKNQIEAPAINENQQNTYRDLDNTPVLPSDNSAQPNNRLVVGFVTSDVSPSMAYVSKRSQILETEFGIDREYIEDHLNMSSDLDAPHELLDYDNYLEGTPLSIGVPENFNEIRVSVYDPSSGNKIESLTFAEWNDKYNNNDETSAEYLNKIPMMIYNEDGKSVAFVRDTDWINPINFKERSAGDRTNAKQNNVRIRANVLEKNNKQRFSKLEAVVTNKNGGVYNGLEIPNNETTTLKKAGGFNYKKENGEFVLDENGEKIKEYQSRVAVWDTKRKVLVIDGETTITKDELQNDSNNFPLKNSSGIEYNYEVRRSGTKIVNGKKVPTYTAFSPNRNIISENISETIQNALQLYIIAASGKNNKFDANIKNVFDQTGIDISTDVGIKKFLSQYIRVFNPGDYKDVKNGKQVAEQAAARLTAGLPYVSIQNNTVYFGVAGDVEIVKGKKVLASPKFLNPKDKDSKRLSSLYSLLFLDKKDKKSGETISSKFKETISNFEQNISKFAIENKTKQISINKKFEVESTGIDYQEHLLDNLESNMQSFNIGTLEDPKWVSRIQPLINYDFPGVENKVKQLVPENLNAEFPSLVEAAKKREESVKGLVLPPAVQQEVTSRKNEVEIKTQEVNDLKNENEVLKSESKVEPTTTEDVEVKKAEIEERRKEELEKPYKTFNDGSGTMVTVTTETTEKDGLRETKFKTQTTNKKGEPRTQNFKGYNTFEEAVEKLDIDLQSEQNETNLELIETLKDLKEKENLPVKVLEVREVTDKSSSFFGLKIASLVVGGEKIEFRLKYDAELAALETQPVVEATAEDIKNQIQENNEEIQNAEVEIEENNNAIKKLEDEFIDKEIPLTAEQVQQNRQLENQIVDKQSELEDKNLELSQTESQFTAAKIEGEIKQLEKEIKKLKNQIAKPQTKQVKAVTYTQQEIADAILQANRDTAWLGDDDLIYDPVEIDDELAEEMAKEMLRIPGLASHHQYQLVDFVFNTLAAKMNFADVKKLDKQQLLDDVLKEFESIINEQVIKFNNRKEILETATDNEDAQKAIEAYDKVLAYMDNILNNKDVIAQDGLKKIFKYTGIQETKEFEEEVHENNEREKNHSKTFLEESGMDSASYQIKRFLGGIQSKDSEGNFITGFLNFPVYVPFDNMYNTIQDILANSDPNFDKMMNTLQEYSKSSPVIGDLIVKLKNADKQIQNQFTSLFAKKDNGMKFVMMTYDSRTNSYSLDVYDTNSETVVGQIQKTWYNNFKDSKLIQTKNGEYYINPEESKKLKEKYDLLLDRPEEIKKRSKNMLTNVIVQQGSRQIKLGNNSRANNIKSDFGNDKVKTLTVGDKTFKLTLKDDVITVSEYIPSSIASMFNGTWNEKGSSDVKDFLSNFGIEISDNTVREIVQNGIYYNGNVISFRELFYESSEQDTPNIFARLNNFLKVNSISKDQEFTKEVNNPLSNIMFKRLAKIESKYNTLVTPPSFRDGQKTISTYTVSKFVTDQVAKLKSESSSGKELRDNLSKTAFSKGSMWLKKLQDPVFRQKFQVDYLGINSFKILGKKLFKSTSITDIADIDHELVKLGLFMSQKTGSTDKYVTFDGQVFDMRMATMFSPTMSDKTTMTIVKTGVVNFDKNDFIQNDKGIIEPTPKVISLMYEQLMLPELNRIIDFYKRGGKTNIKNYDKGAGRFLMFPALNNIKISFNEEGEVVVDNDNSKNSISLIEAIEQNPSFFENSNFILEKLNKQISTIFKQYAENETSNKLKVWKNSGFIESNSVGNVLNFKYFDNLYMEKYSNINDKDKVAKLIAMDFVINNLISNSNSFMAMAGDPAMYYKSNSQDSLTITKDTFNNVGKRLANQIAPGNILADSDTNQYLQIFLEDTESPASNLRFLIGILEGKKFTDEEWKTFEEKWESIQNTKDKNIQKSEKRKFLSEYPKVEDYFEIEGTDAQEYTTWKEHLYVLEKLGKTNPELLGDIKESDLEQAREIISSGKELEEMTDKEKTLVKLVFQPVKPVYTGQIYDEVQGVMRTVYIKSSSFPLIPQFTKGLQIDNLRLAMQKLEADEGKTVRASYQSANKVGALNNPVKLFNNQTSDIKLTQEEILSSIKQSNLVLDRSNFRIQQDVPFKAAKRTEDVVSLGTQTTKLILGDGVTDMSGFYFDEDNPDISGKDLQEIYNNSFQSLIALKENQLYSELGIDPKTGRPINIIASAKKVQKILKEEAENRGYSKQVIESLSMSFIKNDNGKVVDVEFKIPLWMSAESNRFESLLNAVISNRLAKIKMPGNSYVIGSQEGFMSMQDYKGNASKIIYTSKWNGKSLGGAEFDADGNLKKTQVFLPSRFRDNDGKLLDMFAKDANNKYIYVKQEKEGGPFTLNEEMFDNELLSNISFRIPTSAHLSMVDVEIAGILPYETGDLMIVPRNLMVQVGLDFDIDKQTNYQLYHTVDANGKVTVLKEDINALKSDIDNARKQLEDSEYIELEKDVTLAKERISSDLKSSKDKIKEFRKNRISLQPLHNELWELEQNTQLSIDVLNQDILDLQKANTKSKTVDFKKENTEKIQSLKRKRRSLIRDKIKAQTERQNIASTMKNIKESELKEDQLKSDQRKENIDLFLESIKEKKQKIKEIETELKSFIKASEKKYERLLKNEIVKVHSSVLSNKEMQKKINKVLSISDAKKQGEKITNILNPEMTVSNYLFTPMSDEYQKATMKAGSAGKIGIGAYSNDVVFHSLITQNSKPLGLGDSDSIRFGNIVSKGEFGLAKTLGEDGKDGEREVSEVLAERQNIATDNAKELVMNKVNLNAKTLDVDKVLILLGFDLDSEGRSIPFYFLSQPIIKEYIGLLNSYDSITSDYIADKEETAFRILRDKYGFEQDKYGKMSKDNASKMDGLMTGKKLESQLKSFGLTKEIDKDSVLFQQAVLEKFMYLKSIGDEIKKVQRNLNIDSQGIGKSTFDTINKIERLEKLPDSLIKNAESLIGDFEGKRGLTLLEKEVLAKEGYVEFDNWLIKPTTPIGNATVKTLKSANELWSDYLPYNSETFKAVFEEILEMRDVSEGSKVSTKQDVLKEMKKYINSMDMGLYTLSADDERKRLFIDSKDNMSLPKYINELRKIVGNKKVDLFINKNRLVQRLDVDLNKNGDISTAKFNNSVGEKFDEDPMYNALLNLIDKAVDLPLEYNGKPYNTRMLAQDLMNYSLLEGGVQEAVQFSKYIPVVFLSKTAYSSSINNLDLGKVNGGVFGLVEAWEKEAYPYRVSNFSLQYAQHFPNLMPSLSLENISDVKKNNEDSIISFELPLDTDETPKPFYKMYNPASKNSADLFMFTGVKYVKIPSRGVFGMNEYSAQEYGVNESIVKIDAEPKEAVDQPQLKKVKSKEAPTIVNVPFEMDKGSIETSITAIANNNYKGLSDMAKALLPYIDPEVKLAIMKSAGMGAYSESKNTINMNPDEIAKYGSNQEKIARTLLHEYVHSITMKELRNHIKFYKNPITGKMDVIKSDSLKENAPEHVEQLIRLFNDTKKYFDNQYTLDSTGAVSDLEVVNQKMINKEALSSYEKHVVYGATNIFEFLTLATTSSQFQEYMSGNDFKQKDFTKWEKFKKIMQSMLSNLGLEFESPTIASEAINATFQLLEDVKLKKSSSGFIVKQGSDKDVKLITKVDNVTKDTETRTNQQVFGNNIKPQQPSFEVKYTPKGKTQQTYTVVGKKIFNKKGKEVYSKESADKNKIFANLAVQQGRAKVVKYKDSNYIVNNKGVIISGNTGKIMNWGDENGDRKAILQLANFVNNEKELFAKDQGFENWKHVIRSINKRAREQGNQERPVTIEEFNNLTKEQITAFAKVSESVKKAKTTTTKSAFGEELAEGEDANEFLGDYKDFEEVDVEILDDRFGDEVPVSVEPVTQPKTEKVEDKKEDLPDDYDEEGLLGDADDYLDPKEMSPIEKKEYDLGLRKINGRRKTYSLKAYKGTLEKAKRLNLENTDNSIKFTIIKVLGRKGDNKVYNAIAIVNRKIQPANPNNNFNAKQLNEIDNLIAKFKKTCK